MTERPLISVSVNSEAAARVLSRNVVSIGLTLKDHALPWHETKRGTASLLKLRGRHVFVTCCHIWDALQEMRREFPDAQMVAYLVGKNDLCVLSGFHLLDRDSQSLDVAIFGGNESEIFLPGWNFIDYEASYLPDPRPGEPVVIVGYPGENVDVTKQKADFGYMYLVLGVSSVTERQIILRHESGRRTFVDYDEPARAGICLGGLSGSAVYVVRDKIPRFVGIVTECSESESTVDRTIMVSRLGCILPNGTLDHTSIPW